MTWHTRPHSLSFSSLVSHSLLSPGKFSLYQPPKRQKDKCLATTILIGKVAVLQWPKFLCSPPGQLPSALPSLEDQVSHQNGEHGIRETKAKFWGSPVHPWPSGSCPSAALKRVWRCLCRMYEETVVAEGLPGHAPSVGHLSGLITVPHFLKCTEHFS